MVQGQDTPRGNINIGEQPGSPGSINTQLFQNWSSPTQGNTSGKAKPRSSTAWFRTTQWSKKKALEAAAGGDEASNKKVRKYTCPGCAGLATNVQF